MSDENTKTVSVGCKLPAGLHLDLKSNDGNVRVTLKGSNDSHIIGGYGLTHNVSAEFMKEWLRKNAKHPAVVNNAIFIHSDASSAEAIAKERREISTGLEAVDPIKSGMLKGADGQVDQAALAKLNEQRLKNPERNRQRVE